MKIRIGELAKIASCPVVTIRFYEKQGLLPVPERTSGNYRVYGDEDIKRLRFVMHCRRHGMKLAEIRQLLAFRDNPARECGFVHRLVEEHLANVDAQIASLAALKEELLALSAVGGCNGKNGCAILGTLNAADDCCYCRDIRKLEREAGLKIDTGHE